MQPAANIQRAYSFANLSAYSFKERWLIRAAEMTAIQKERSDD